MTVNNIKIAIIGYSGSGKSTLAGVLAQQYQIPLMHLDTVKYLAGWKEREITQAKKVAADFMQNDSWVIDGNYNMFYRQERLDSASEIVFMNFNRVACLFRAVKRYFKYKNTTRESMAEGCSEKLDGEFLWWLIYAGRTKERRKSFKVIISKNKSKTVVIKNQKQLDRYMRSKIQY